MKIIGFPLLFVLMIAFAGGAAVSRCTGDARLERTQRYADSLLVIDVRKDSELMAASIATTNAVVKLARAEQHNRDVAKTDALRNDQIDDLLTHAQSASDSNALRGQQVAVLKHEVLTLNQALANADSQVVEEHAGRIKAEGQVHDLTAQIVSLDAKLKQLSPRGPKWLRTLTTIGTHAAAFVAGRASR